MISRAFYFQSQAGWAAGTPGPRGPSTDPRVRLAAGVADQIHCPHRRAAQPRQENPARPALALTVQESSALQLLWLTGGEDDRCCASYDAPDTPHSLQLSPVGTERELVHQVVGCDISTPASQAQAPPRTRVCPHGSGFCRTGVSGRGTRKQGQPGGRERRGHTSCGSGAGGCHIL